MLFIGFVGILMRLSSNFKLNVLILSIWTIFTYALSCWWHWPYGDSFGHRAFIDLYAIPTIGLVYFINYCKLLLQKICLVIVSVVFLFFNLFQTWQFGKFILSPEYMSFDKYKATLFATNDNLVKELGGPKDIFPYNANYRLVSDSILFIDMNHTEYSPSIKFTHHPKTYKKCYLNAEFIKEESLPNQSFNAKLLFQIEDTISKEVRYFACCLNEGVNDYTIPNSELFSYQFDFAALKPAEVLTAFFTNPERKLFFIKKVKISLYYIY
jgi:hypothetical protein